jgi:hypothetical protein
MTYCLRLPDQKITRNCRDCTLVTAQQSGNVP